MEKRLDGILRHKARTRPDAVALAAPEGPGDHLSRRLGAVTAMVGRPGATGLGRGDRVAVALPNGFPFAETERIVSKVFAMGSRPAQSVAVTASLDGMMADSPPVSGDPRRQGQSIDS